MKPSPRSAWALLITKGKDEMNYTLFPGTGVKGTGQTSCMTSLSQALQMAPVDGGSIQGFLTLQSQMMVSHSAESILEVLSFLGFSYTQGYSSHVKSEDKRSGLLIMSSRSVFLLETLTKHF